MIKILGLNISQAGRNKLKAIKETVETTAKNTLDVSMRQIVKLGIVAAAPSHNEERNVLSQDITGLGTPRGDRFLKIWPQRFLKDALIAEPIYTNKKGLFGMIESRFGRIDVLNKRIGFSWRTQVKAKTLKSTLDTNAFHQTWNRLLQLWETGGQFTVTSRKPKEDLLGLGFSSGIIGYDLQPAPGKFVPMMTKRIPKKSMVSRGYFKNRTLMQDSIEKNIKSAIRRIR